jgi:DNA invertase Pin-like site-specific DNA recombinase
MTPKVQLTGTPVDPKNMPAGTRVLLYVRNSPGDNQTIESQEQALINLCKERGWIIVDIFRDKWESGKTVSREGFEYMAHIARQQPRKGDMVVIWDFSRFGRSQDNQLFYTAEMRMNGWVIYSYNDDIPSGSLGRVFESLIAWKNEQFLLDLRLNTIRGLAYIAERGCVPVGTVGKGYKAKLISLDSTKQDGTLRMGRKPEIDPQTAPLIKTAYEMKVNGASHKAIAEATGLYSSNSGSWNHLFSNRIYIGKYEFHGKLFTNIYPPIINNELFDAVQTKIIPKERALKMRRMHPRRKGSSFFLASQSVCKFCNHPMEGKSVGKHRYYICSQHNEGAGLCPEAELIPADATEQEILRILLNHIVQEDHLNELHQWTNKLLNSGLDEIAMQLNILEDEYADAQRQARRMTINFGTMETPSKFAEQALHDAETKTNRLEVQIIDLRQRIAQSHIEATPEQIKNLSTNYEEMINQGEYFDLREIIEELCARIVMSRDECVLEVHFPSKDVMV